jgi:hypothetical protein
MNVILAQLQEQAASLPLPLQRELLNYALYLTQKAQDSIPERSVEERRSQLSRALEQAAVLNPYGDVADPVAWQQGQRQDRSLPGRDYAD